MPQMAGMNYIRGINEGVPGAAVTANSTVAQRHDHCQQGALARKHFDNEPKRTRSMDDCIAQSL